MDYKAAGVNTEYAQRLIQNLKERISKTHTVPDVGSVVGQYGGFAGRFELIAIPGFDAVAATDGVGTKTQLLRRFNYLEGIGQDLVAMCVNDLFCAGATPAFFLDYIACGKLSESWYNRVLSSITDACAFTPMALLGGETAEHPGVMPDDDFDLAGFAVGFIPRERVMPDFAAQRQGDLVIGIPSSGLHSNGFSLVRKIFQDLEKNNPTEFQTMVADRENFLDTWLNPTRIYKEVPALLQKTAIKGVAHITGGGIHENLPRAVRQGLGVRIENAEPFRLKAAAVLEKFVERDKLFHTFNMGTGLILIADAMELSNIREAFSEAQVMGRLVEGQGVQIL